MEISKLRQKIYYLDKERNKLLKKIMRPGKMIQGTLYQIARLCGHPNCKCAKGQKHVSWYLSRSVEGKTKLTYIGPIVPIRISEQVKRYQQYQKMLAKIRSIDADISVISNRTRNYMLQTIEEVTRRKK